MQYEMQYDMQYDMQYEMQYNMQYDIHEKLIHFIMLNIYVFILHNYTQISVVGSLTLKN